MELAGFRKYHAGTTNQVNRDCKEGGKDVTNIIGQSDSHISLCIRASLMALAIMSTKRFVDIVSRERDVHKPKVAVRANSMLMPK